MTQPIRGIAQCHRLWQSHWRLFAHMQWTHDTPRGEAIVVHLMHGARLLRHNLMAAEVRIAYNAAHPRVPQAYGEYGEYTQGAHCHLVLLQQHVVYGEAEREKIRKIRMRVS